MRELRDAIMQTLFYLSEQTGEIPCGTLDGFVQTTGAPRYQIKLAIRQLLKEQALHRIVINGHEFYTFEPGMKQSDIATLTVWDVVDK